MRVYVALVAFFSFISSTSSHIIHYTSTRGLCINTCGYHGHKYTWCYQKGGKGHKWDYCSVKAGLDASGQECDTSCNLWGGSYHYCYLKNGRWNYCSLLQERDVLEFSLKKNLCVKSCRVSAAVFQCETIFGLESCSPFQDVTFSGLPCHREHRCASNGIHGYHCHTSKDESERVLCRPRDKDGCNWILSSTNNSQIETCTLAYSQKEGNVIFRRERQSKAHSPTKEQFREATYLIDKIASIRNLPDSRPVTKVYFYKGKNVLCNGIYYNNVELRYDSIETKPIAHVIFPVILKVTEVLRLALYTSLHSSFYLPAFTIVVSVNKPMSCPIRHN